PLIQLKFVYADNSTNGLVIVFTVRKHSFNFSDKPQFNEAFMPTNLNKSVKDKFSLFKSEDKRSYEDKRQV
ncbi:hypothetical protein ACQ1ZO_16730, partial [Enterococcus faecalis]|uniref:hypothetical protein n=1 Tax=Enterococcus faecalis TaxID=1351 RepID=UPI003D6AC816